MQSTTAQPLDYEPSALGPQRKPVTWRTFRVPALIVVLAAALSPTGMRMVPGGPFISIHADVIPVLMCITVVPIVWRAFRTTRGLLRFGSACLILSSALVVISVIDNVMSFWLRPAARGALFGW